MKLEVGMYCYDKCNRKAGIGKITEARQHQNYIIEYKKYSKLVSVGNIIASFNPIGLIKVGDFVNGHQVYEVDRECYRITLNGGDIGEEFRFTYLRPALGKNMGIKTILTKEQFENYCFEIGDE